MGPSTGAGSTLQQQQQSTTSAAAPTGTTSAAAPTAAVKVAVFKGHMDHVLSLAGARVNLGMDPVGPLGHFLLLSGSRDQAVRNWVLDLDQLSAVPPEQPTEQKQARKQAQPQLGQRQGQGQEQQQDGPQHVHSVGGEGGACEVPAVTAAAGGPALDPDPGSRMPLNAISVGLQPGLAAATATAGTEEKGAPRPHAVEVEITSAPSLGPISTAPGAAASTEPGAATTPGGATAMAASGKGKQCGAAKGTSAGAPPSAPSIPGSGPSGPPSSVKRLVLPPAPDLSEPRLQEQAQQEILQLAALLYPSAVTPSSNGSSSSSLTGQGRAVAMTMAGPAGGVSGWSPVGHSAIAAPPLLPCMLGDVALLSASGQLPVATAPGSTMTEQQQQQQLRYQRQLLCLHNGDVKGALCAALVAGTPAAAGVGMLSAELLASCACAGMQVWAAASRLFAVQQEAAGRPAVAAQQLLAAGDTEAAAAVYRYCAESLYPTCLQVPCYHAQPCIPITLFHFCPSPTCKASLPACLPASCVCVCAYVCVVTPNSVCDTAGWTVSALGEGGRFLSGCTQQYGTAAVSVVHCRTLLLLQVLCNTVQTTRGLCVCVHVCMQARWVGGG